MELRLAVCVQITPIHSIYRWRGKVESADELLLAAKTPASRVTRLMKQIRTHHPYELPEIVVHTIAGGLPEYLRWVREETRTVGDPGSKSSGRAVRRRRPVSGS